MNRPEHSLKLSATRCTVAAALALGLGPATSFTASADPESGKTGYAVARDGQVVQSGTGECVHTSSWKPSLAIVGCDGKTQPAPEPVAKVTVVETEVAAVETPPTRFSLDAATYFDFDKAILREDGKDKLNSIAQRIGNDSTIARVEVTGHTDRIGPEEYNAQLSRERAEAVTQYLRQHAGIDSSKFVVRGVGESHSITSCEDTRSDSELIKCLQPDRRVEIAIDGEKRGEAPDSLSIR